MAESRGKPQRPMEDIPCKNLLLSWCHQASYLSLSLTQHILAKSHHNSILLISIWFSMIPFCFRSSSSLIPALLSCTATSKSTSSFLCLAADCAAGGWFRALHTESAWQEPGAGLSWQAKEDTDICASHVTHFSLILSCHVSGFLTFQLKVQR